MYHYQNKYLDFTCDNFAFAHNVKPRQLPCHM